MPAAQPAEPTHPEARRLIGQRSRAHIWPFRLYRPQSLAELCALRAALPEAALMAGGIDLIDRLKWGTPVPQIIHLACVPELACIATDANSLCIGAIATHHQVAESAAVRQALPDLARLWQGIGNPRIRAAGTLGGNLMARNPAYDGMPALLALGAQALLATPDATLAAQPLATLPASAVLAGLRIGLAPRVSLRAERSLLPMVAAWLGLRWNGPVLHSAVLAVGAAHPQAVSVALPVAGLDQAALRQQAPILAQLAAASLPEPSTDALASAGYRRRMIAILCCRLLQQDGERP